MLKICRRALTAAAVMLTFALGGWTIYCYRQGFTYEYMQTLLGVFLLGAAGIGALGTAVILLRGKATAEKAQRGTPYPEHEMPGKQKNILRGVMIALAALLIGLGIANGGLWDALVKAINICTECIGLG